MRSSKLSADSMTSLRGSMRQLRESIEGLQDCCGSLDRFSQRLTSKILEASLPGSSDGSSQLARSVLSLLATQE